MGPPMPSADVLTQDGLLLFVEHRPLPDPRARVLLVHGYAEHRRRYAELVQRLEAVNLECHLFDLRGHGQSEGPRGHVPRFADYLDDLHRVLATLPRTLPLLLFGHSLGGLIALEYVRNHPHAVDALAVTSPYLGPAFRIPRTKAMLASLLSRLAPTLALPNGLDPRWVSRDPEVVRAYREDPLVFGTTTPRWFTEITAAQHTLFAHAPEIITPTAFLIAGSDRIADARIAPRLFERLRSTDKQLIVYDALHHEVLNELRDVREIVIHDLISWLSRSWPVHCRQA